MHRKFIWSVILLCQTGLVLAQVDVVEALKAQYTFDQCDGTDDSGNNSTGEVTGAQCQCGVSGESLFFNGVDDHIQFQGNINEYFKANNFTISLYFKPSSSSPNSVLLSKYDSCNVETGLVMQYGNGSIAVSLKGVSGIENNLNVSLENTGCWIHLALVRRGSAIELYENGVLVGEDDNGFRNTDITNDGLLTLGKGQCDNPLNKPFRGNIDELTIYNQPLSALQIQKLLLPVDQIATPDTVVAIGSTFSPGLSKTCAGDISWTFSNNPETLSGPNPEISISKSTTLTAVFNHGSCISRDSITVRVVNSEDIECGNIPMARAFTPNGDGLNDSYSIILPGAIENLISFEIFNQWNDLIFRTENASDMWDGTFDGKKLNPGGFLYKIRYQCMNREYVKTGEFLLLN